MWRADYTGEKESIQGASEEASLAIWMRDSDGSDQVHSWTHEIF